MKNNLWSIIAILSISSGCYDNVDTSPPDEVIIEIPQVFITTQLSGSVIDSDDQFINDYLLEINDKFSDISSDYFLVEIENALKKGQTIKVIKDGNPIGIKTELLIENDINHLQIASHDVFRSETKTKENATVQLRKYITADFTEYRSTTSYDSDLTIEYINIDPEQSLTSVAYDDLSDLLVVETHGGFYLNASFEDGTVLDIDPKYPVILQLGDLEDDSNGLFKFDDQNDAWILTSEISSNMEVDILAEGYYALGEYSPGVFVEGIVSKDEKPVAYQLMNWDHDGIQNKFYTTESGRWITVLPEKNEININLLNLCDESLQSETITINTDDLKDQNITISNDENYQFLNTTVIDCDGNVINNSTINVASNGNESHFVFASPDQDRWIVVCDEYTLATYNETTEQTGSQLQLTSALANEEIILSDCADSENGFNFIQIRDEIEVYEAFEAEIIGDKTVITSRNGEFKLIIKGNSPGQYEESQINIAINDTEFGSKGYFISCETSEEGCGIDMLNITKLEQGTNGQVSLTFSGRLWMQTLNPQVAGNYDISGTIFIQQ